MVAAGVNLVRGDNAVSLEKRQNRQSTPPPERHLWGSGNGWFSAAYGPFRRFAGGDKEAERTFFQTPNWVRTSRYLERTWPLPRACTG